MKSVHSAVRTGYFNKAVCASSLKAYVRWQRKWIWNMSQTFCSIYGMRWHKIGYNVFTLFTSNIWFLSKVYFVWCEPPLHRSCT